MKIDSNTYYTQIVSRPPKYVIYETPSRVKILKRVARTLDGGSCHYVDYIAVETMSDAREIANKLNSLED